ncbi:MULTISPECIES: hypothetical protein [Nocardioides]|uniref:Uncharacterized protein n=1 Tax=Nocardioides vastitatis TaxID=2568655 RepID=A0ABW0ZNI6_9ACTN|nr:hypothetical protein [Nocardioides sp.]THJ10717.1 hypothetical protein E7Z54_02555 [Nocardioides sp.]
MTRVAVIRWAGVAAVAGGVCWVVKGGVILLTGKEPPVVFAVSFALLPVALVGLYAAAAPRGDRLAKPGLALAATAGVAAVVAGLGSWLGPNAWSPRQDTVTILTPFIALAGFGTLAALILLGIAVRRTSALPHHWRTFPLVIGIGFVPLMILGGILENIDERLLEVPIVIGGGRLARPGCRHGDC